MESEAENGVSCSYWMLVKNSREIGQERIAGGSNRILLLLDQRKKLEHMF